MEAKLTAYIFQRLLDEHFHTKRNMARQLNISYDKLLRVWKSDHLTGGGMEAVEQLMHYCIRERIPLDGLVRDFH